MKKRCVLLAAILAAAFVLPSCGTALEDEVSTSQKDAEQTAEGVDLTGTQQIVVEGFDWGPCNTKTIVKLNQIVATDTVNAESFQVTDYRPDYIDDDSEAGYHIEAVEHERTVNAAYTSDEKGNQIEEDSQYITLEMYCSPDEGLVFVWDDDQSLNVWDDPYELTITLTEAAQIKTADGMAAISIKVDSDALIENMYAPVNEKFTVDDVYTGKDGTALTYTAYAPEADGSKHPLVIWLHGAGAGGTDTRMALFDTKCTALVEEDFQNTMGGAYVLVPQCDGFWMQYDDSGSWFDNPGTASIYTPTLMELIEHYVAENQDVDVNRILIGGCSNGGYMTMEMIMTYPEYFAAAYPISEAYRDEGISDAMLEAIKEVPVWFVYSNNDATIDPAANEIPTIERLEKISKDLKKSVYEKVIISSGEWTNEDGTPYEFTEGHESWVYFFNNECECDGVNMWDWMAEQSK